MSIDRLLCCFPFLGTASNEKKESEDSGLLKIASCVPAIGFFVNQMQSDSLRKKLELLHLPKKFRPDGIPGNVLDERATPEEKKAACQRAVELKSIMKDYTKTALVSSILTVAIAVYALVINVIPFFIGAFVIGGYSITAATFAFLVYLDHSRDCIYEKEIKKTEKILDVNAINNPKLSIADHAAKILPSYQNALNKKDKEKAEIGKIDDLISQYKAMAELYTDEVKRLFLEADFLIDHGAIHVSHVALMVPVMVNFYRICDDERAKKLTSEELTALQIAALYHDYGRTVDKDDLTNDSEKMESNGADACYQYLIENGFDKKIAMRAKDAIQYKDKHQSGSFYTAQQFKDKDIFAEILQNCDCVAYLRSYCGEFNPKYLDVIKRLQISNQTDKTEALYQILDATKLFLVSMSDSPREHKPLSKKYKASESDQEKFLGKMNVDDKRRLETSSNCFTELQSRMSNFEDLVA